jgi:2-desacetyl-2-hydroxyethyl bacteriochlorophyllide A dehydrogenase
MRAITLAPGKPHSVRLEEVAEPGEGGLLVKTLAIGVCGTDRELIEGGYGEAPPGRERMVLGHESLGQVVEAPQHCNFAKGDMVVGIVRHPDPVPCSACAAGEWDMCRNGRYTERGIKQADGFAAEYFRVAPAMAVKVDGALGLAGVLLEPASVLAKAWEHIERIGARAHWAPERVLVTGAGPVGLMAAMIGLQKGLEVHVLDHNQSGPKPALVKALGAAYHVTRPDFDPDIIVECTGAPKVVTDALCNTAPGGIVCLTGLSSGRRRIPFDIEAFNQVMVLENNAVFGSVNANRRHYEAAARALAKAERGWLDKVLTRRVSLKNWHQAYEKRDGDVKTVLCLEN